MKYAATPCPIIIDYWIRNLNCAEPSEERAGHTKVNMNKCKLLKKKILAHLPKEHEKLGNHLKLENNYFQTFFPLFIIM